MDKSQRTEVSGKHDVHTYMRLDVSVRERKATDEHTNLGLCMHFVSSMITLCFALHRVHPAQLQTGGVLTDTQTDVYILEVRTIPQSNFLQ